MPATSEPLVRAEGSSARRGMASSARVASGGLVLVLLVLTAFSVVAAVLTTRAGHQVQASAAAKDAYQAAELALTAEEGLEHEYLFKRSPAELSDYEQSADAASQALRLVRDVESAEHRARADWLVRQHDQYRSLVPALFAHPDARQASAFDEQHLEPLLTEVRQTVTTTASEHQAEAGAALAHLLDVQRLVLWTTPVVFGIGLALLVAFIAVLRSSRRALAAQADANRHQALHDPLTGLPNRTLLQQRAEGALARAGTAVEPVALLLVDLDRFREINDTLGHHCGDLVLQAVATRLPDVVGPAGTVARLGGDEFAILLPAVPDLRAAIDVADRVRGVLEVAVEVAGTRLDVDASVGVVVSGEHGDDVDTLLRRADIAMYGAKARGLGVCPYEPGLADPDPERLGLLGELRRALDDGELVLHFQPKVALSGGEVVGVEALVRWQHPERGLVPPGLFIPLAEQTALIGPLTRYVLDAALAHCRRWRNAGRSLTVAVNVSARNLLDETFVDDVLELLARWRVPPSALELEVTESAIMADPVRAKRVLSRLAHVGITLSVDDFGAGYTSLAHLKELPVHQLKIDRSFVAALTTERSDAAIVAAVVDLARTLGLHTVAEGVEDQATLDELTRLGCDVAQGYHLSRPLPADQLDVWLRGVPQVAALAA